MHLRSNTSRRIKTMRRNSTWRSCNKRRETARVKVTMISMPLLLNADGRRSSLSHLRLKLSNSWCASILLGKIVNSPQTKLSLLSALLEILLLNGKKLREATSSKMYK